MHCAKCFFYETDVGDEVCDRCGRAYLPEANVYLGLVVLVTGGLAWTLRYVLTGHVDLFVRPQVDLGAWATWPVSMVDRPAYGLVLGGWLAMLAAAPILTGMMYGKRGGWLLTVVVAAFGPSVVFAGAIALGVWIAAGHTLRLRSKLSSALLGLAPIIIYWFVATALTDFSKGATPAAATVAEVALLAQAGRGFPPGLRSLAYLPPVMGAVTAAAACAAVVGIGWADRWHIRWPGVLLTVLTAAPVPALLALVGIDEIRYGMVLAEGQPVGPSAEAGGSESGRLREFLRRHPGSPRADQVRARLARNLEKTPDAAETEAGAPPAEKVWKELLEAHPDSPWAAEARRHLGDSAGRQGLFDQAETLYGDALAQTAAFESPSENPLADFNIIWDLFSVGRDLRTREMADRLAAVRQDVLMRLALLADNRQATAESARALALYFVALGIKGTNPYREALLAARDADPNGTLADNVAYDLAMFEADDAKRIQGLAEVATRWPGADGALLAHVKAAQGLFAQTASDPGAMREARAHLLAAQKNLLARKKRKAEDFYVAALEDRVEKELVYVQAQLRSPDADR